MAGHRNIFACLVHESPECVTDLIRNLRCLDPQSTVLLYNGSSDPGFLLRCNGIDDAVVHPSAQPMSWGTLHGFALDCMRYASEHLSYDTLTIVDSDQLALKPGYSDYIGNFLASQPEVGMLGKVPHPLTAQSVEGPVRAAFQEIELWRPFLRRFADGEQKFGHWTFWPSTVFTASAARDLTKLFDRDQEFRSILAQSKIWATEEVVLPLLTALLGYRIAVNPCHYEYVRYRQEYSAAQAESALQQADAYWMHPVPRQYAHPLRQLIRNHFSQYMVMKPGAQVSLAGREVHRELPPGSPKVSCLMPTADRPQFVSQAIRYFLKQDYADRELVIIDDGAHSIQHLIPSDPRIQYIRRSGRLTIGAKHNLACEQARGDVMVHWDDDDWMANWRISYQVQELLKSPGRLCGLSRLHFYEPATRRAWEYQYPMHDRPWVGGGTFCYARNFWRGRPFPDMNEGGDTVFVWSLKHDEVASLEDHRFYVGTVHPGNTSLKKTAGAGWHSCLTEAIRVMMEEPDWQFYESLTEAPCVSC